MLSQAQAKDPLQSEQTAYEILALDRTASDRDVQAAFAMGVARRVNVQKLTAARNVLLSPLDRALLDLFHYLPECSGHLSPSPIQQPLVLEPSRRGSSAYAWETQLRTGFPDLGAAHSLAVLWYWSAVAADSGHAADAKAGQPVHQLWRNAIGCWAIVLASEEFWTAPYFRIDAAAAAKARSAIQERLVAHIRSASQRHHQNGTADAAAQYHRLELDLTSEVRTAKLVRGAGIRNGRGKLTAGALMLGHLGLLDTVREQVEAGLKRAPGNSQLKAVGDALSPYAPIALLIDTNRPRPALEALDALQPSEKRLNEVRVLRAKALRALAKQQSSLNEMDAALKSWEEALQSLPTAEHRSEIVADIVADVQARATSLQANQPDQAISLLEQSVKLTESAQLKQILAEHLVNRSIRVMNEAQEKIKEAGSSVAVQARADLTRALQDIERAAALGSRRAKEQLDTAREVFAGAVALLDSGFADLAPEAAALVSQANQVASEGKFDEAIDLLRQALNRGNARSSAVVRKQLARLLSARAVDGVNSATAVANQFAESSSKQRQKAVNDYYRSHSSLVQLVALLANGSFWVAMAPIFYFMFENGNPNRVIGGLVVMAAIFFVLFFVYPIRRAIVASSRATHYHAARPADLLCAFCLEIPCYTMSLPGRGSQPLCEAHANELRKIMDVDVGTYFVTTAVESAIRDLEEAQRLDPDFVEAGQHLRQLRQMQG